MSDVILTDYQKALRAAHEQVQMLEHVYEEQGEDARGRLAELNAYREALMAELRREKLLPSSPDPERESLQLLLSHLKEALTEEKSSLIKRAEEELDEFGRQLEACAASLPPAVERGIRQTREITGEPG